MFCGECGLRLEEGWKACPRCGAIRPQAETPVVAGDEPTIASGQPAVAADAPTIATDAATVSSDEPVLPPGEPTAVLDEPVASKPSRRPLFIGIGVALALALIIAGLVLSRGPSKPTALHKIDSTSAPDTTAQPTATSHASTSGAPQAATGSAVSHEATPTAVQAPINPPEPRPIHLTGNGAGTSGSFNVAGGLTVFRPHCVCDGTFTVELIDPNGGSKGKLADSTGRYDGSVGKHLAAGSYRLKVNAQQRWDVVIDQPRDRRGDPLPQRYAGPGDMFVGPFTGGGSVRLTADKKGSGNFIVEVLSSTGVTLDIPINKVGNFSGSADAHDLSGAPYYLNVSSDGPWSVTVSST